MENQTTDPEIGFFNCGVSEGYKGGVHLAMFGLFAVCAAYNLGCLLSRPKTAFRSQFIYYTIASIHEARQVRKHWSR